ncbi:MAG: AAA family ATPase [Clostridiales bacterium]|jgi:MoxR-like ATPase|nr:AAA family ATPase [Clostridiales bacterium]
MPEKLIKPPVELMYKDQLDILAEMDKGSDKPDNWALSPKAVRTFILGHKDKTVKLKVSIQQKYYGDDALVERCIIALAGNRGLMLVGEPGTAKTMLSELLSAAISGTSLNTVQGSAGTTDDNIKYSWNYALLLAKGATREALVPAPLYIGMENGIITRFEELTRCPSEVQDALISAMSDKVLSIPELGPDGFIFAKPGFNVIGTANTRDRGVNEMSSALKRRFNFETVFPINSVPLESRIIEEQCRSLLGAKAQRLIDKDIIGLIASAFHEMRTGQSAEGTRIDSPSAAMSTAEAVSVYYQTALSGFYYENGKISVDSLAQNLLGAIVKENREDAVKLRSYFNSVVKARSKTQGGAWEAFYEARKWIR